MSSERDQAGDYLVGHLEEALATDPRVAEEGLHVSLEGAPPTVVVTGTVVAGAHKDLILDVVCELVPGLPVRDETTVADYPEPDCAGPDGRELLG